MSSSRMAADRPALVVPAYFHPAVRATDWQRLAARAQQVRLVVLNIASGAGERPDNAFLPVLDEMMEGGLVTLEKVQVIHYRSYQE